MALRASRKENREQRDYKQKSAGEYRTVLTHANHLIGIDGKSVSEQTRAERKAFRAAAFAKR